MGERYSPKAVSTLPCPDYLPLNDGVARLNKVLADIVNFVERKLSQVSGLYSVVHVAIQRMAMEVGESKG